jgi:hypothetical protein
MLLMTSLPALRQVPKLLRTCAPALHATPSSIGDVRSLRVSTLFRALG